MSAAEARSLELEEQALRFLDMKPMSAGEIRNLALHVIAYNGVPNVGVARDIAIARLTNTKRTAMARAELQLALEAVDRSYHWKEIAQADQDVAHVSVRDALLATARRAYDRCGYRRSESNWAGGAHRITIDIDMIAYASARGGSERARSKNNKWSGTNSWAHIRLSPHYAEVARRNLLTVKVKGVTRMVLAFLGTSIPWTKGKHGVVYLKPGRGFDLMAADVELIGIHADCLEHPDLHAACGCGRIE